MSVSYSFSKIFTFYPSQNNLNGFNRRERQKGCHRQVCQISIKLWGSPRPQGYTFAPWMTTLCALKYKNLIVFIVFVHIKLYQQFLSCCLHLIVPESFEKYCYSCPIPELINPSLQETGRSRGVESICVYVSEAPQMFLICFPNGKISCYPILRILSPKIHVLLTLSVGGAHSTCQLPPLAGKNPKSLEEVRSRSRVFPFTTPTLKTDGRTYLHKQYVSGVEQWGQEWAEECYPLFITRL